MAPTNHCLMDAVLCKEFNGHVFEICIVTNFDYFSQIRISHLPYKEILMITRNTLGLEGIIVLLRDRKSAVLNISVYKASL